MQIRVGITASDLTSYRHSAVKISCPGGLVVSAGGREEELAGPLEVRSEGRGLSVFASGNKVFEAGQDLNLKAALAGKSIQIENVKRLHGASSLSPAYHGQVELALVGGAIRIVVVTDLEDYVFGVLASEMPASYHIEAIKAQAVAARTYGLNPRVSHAPQGFNVCDSYLCCQYFVGIAPGISAKHRQAIESTSGQILVYAGKPILALFSACAGGHTESYEYCFSDPKTNQFPAPPIPYLQGVAEGKLPQNYPEESALRALYEEPHPETCDQASSCFRWQVRFTADNLECHMHHVVDKLRQDPQTAPFIVAPREKQFGHIKRFEIKQRGVAATAVEMDIRTSSGVWTVKKELVIRSVFANPDLHLPRLKSARVFFEHKYDRLGLLASLTVFGFGFGHGVGMQQHGAQGLALAGKSYLKILHHYFDGAEIAQAKS